MTWKTFEETITETKTGLLRPNLWHDDDDYDNDDGGGGSGDGDDDDDDDDDRNV